VVFRAANERIYESAMDYEVTRAIPFLCECPDASCAAIIRLDAEEYERIRKSGRFFNAPGHAEPFLTTFHVEERHSNYDLVARNTMPRSMDERLRKIGINEAVFREVNERIEELARSFGLGDQELDLVCECGDASCTQQIRMIGDEYEAMRKDSTLFAVHPGHEMPEAEDVVATHDGYDIVRKHAGEPAEIAKSTDPRS
jgi:hypothetical protein